jgi:hypothetical protein
MMKQCDRCGNLAVLNHDEVCTECLESEQVFMGLITEVKIFAKTLEDKGHCKKMVLGSLETATEMLAAA